MFAIVDLNVIATEAFVASLAELVSYMAYLLVANDVRLTGSQI